MKVLLNRELPPNMGIKRAMYILQDGRCPYCGCKMILTNKHEMEVSPEERRYIATEEHLTPRSRHGDNTHRNRMLACSECNVKRGNGPAYVGMFAVKGVALCT